MSYPVSKLADVMFDRETLIFQTWSFQTWEFCLDRKMRLLEESFSGRSLSEYWGVNPLKLDSLVSPSTSDKVKNETSSILKLCPPKDAPY